MKLLFSESIPSGVKSEAEPATPEVLRRLMFEFTKPEHWDSHAVIDLIDDEGAIIESMYGYTSLDLYDDPEILATKPKAGDDYHKHLDKLQKMAIKVAEEWSTDYDTKEYKNMLKLMRGEEV